MRLKLANGARDAGNERNGMSFQGKVWVHSLIPSFPEHQQEKSRECWLESQALQRNPNTFSSLGYQARIDRSLDIETCPRGKPKLQNDIDSSFCCLTYHSETVAFRQYSGRAREPCWRKTQENQNCGPVTPIPTCVLLFLMRERY